MIPLIPAWTITRSKNPPKKPNGGTRTRSRGAQRTQDINYPVVRFTLNKVNLMISALAASQANLRSVWESNDILTDDGFAHIYQATIALESLRELIEQLGLCEHVKEYRHEDTFLKLTAALEERMERSLPTTRDQAVGLVWANYQECSHILRQTESREGEKP